jgi:acyl carrier protein
VFTGAVLPVGYPVEDKEVVLLDDAGHKVGFNQIGEITVKSRYMSLGYWRRPDLTQRAFSPDPQSNERRVYRTGNVGRLLLDGCLEHLGRKDFQVKIRGHRIEMEEIEVTLLDHPSVKAVAVIVHEGPTERCLVAHWVPGGGSPPTVNELRSFLRERLPDYMVPSFFLKVDALPLLANGKVDRQALPSLDPARTRGNAAFVAPRTPVEKQIADIWREVLRQDPIGIDDNFFELGGHSLAATRVMVQVVKQFQVDLPLKSLFDSPTVAEMAVVITAHQGTNLRERELQRILTELESLSEEEAQKLLADTSKNDEGRRHE